MRVIIDPYVYEVIDDFYETSRREHVTLDLETCIAKINRLEAAIYHFAEIAETFHKVPYREDWAKAGYLEFFIEDFHFAYKIYEHEDGSKVLIIHDVVHSLLNYKPEDR